MTTETDLRLITTEVGSYLTAFEDRVIKEVLASRSSAAEADAEMLRGFARLVIDSR